MHKVNSTNQSLNSPTDSSDNIRRRNEEAAFEIGDIWQSLEVPNSVESNTQSRRKWARGAVRPTEPGIDDILAASAAYAVTKLTSLNEYRDADHWTPIGEYVAFGNEDFPSEFVEALKELDQVVGTASEEDLPVPSAHAVENARRLIREIYSCTEFDFEVYPTPDQEVAIDVLGNNNCSVIALCDSDGGASCLVNTAGTQRRARYSKASLLLDSFVREAFTELARASG